MSAPRVAELFAGVGGMALGLHRAGYETAWLAEIAEFPQRVLQERFAGVALYGDVTQLDGRSLVESHGALDLIAGGSPCQDLSVAGKRKGLAGARSGLFHHQMRLWSETGADLCLWENVAGALSSHHGKDFAAVLSAFVGAAVAVPRDGWTAERCSGVVSGPAGVAAWRLLDAQYFGVPQRRLRIFVLGSRSGRVDPAEILLEPEGVRWDSPASREAGQGASNGPRTGVAYSLGSHAGADEGSVTNESHASGGPTGFGISEEMANTLRAGRVGSVVSLQEVGKRTGASTTDPRAGLGISEPDDPMYTLQASAQHGVIAFHMKGDGSDCQRELSTSLRANADSYGGAPPCIVDVASTLVAGGRETGPHGALDSVNLVVAINNDSRAAVTANAPPLRAGERAAPSVLAGIPRRLMPIECERLMSWPDGWTNVPDEKGKPASDAVRYKAIGNGVASNVAEWIGRRILLATRSFSEAA